MNVIASLVDRPPEPADCHPTYYVRPTGAALAQHGLPTGIQRGRKGRYRAVVRRRYSREFDTVEEALAWRELVVAVLGIPRHIPANDPVTEAVRVAVLRGGIRALGL